MPDPKPAAVPAPPEPVTFAAFVEGEGVSRADAALLRVHMPKQAPTTVEGWAAALASARKERI